MPIWTNLLHPICQLTMIAVRYLCERMCISEHVCLCLCHYDSFLCMHMFVQVNVSNSAAHHFFKCCRILWMQSSVIEGKFTVMTGHELHCIRSSLSVFHEAN